MSRVKIMMVGARYKEEDEHDVELERRLTKRISQTGELLRESTSYRVRFDDETVEEFFPVEVIHLTE